jgi:hypothetical protein
MERIRSNRLSIVPRCLVPLVFALLALSVHGYSQSPSPMSVNGTRSIYAGPNRPANVPESYVITPNGYFHPSCVHQLAAAETVLGDGRIQHADGTVDAVAPVCAYPRFSRAGARLGDANPSATSPSTELSGWLENANTTAWAYGTLISTFVVPNPPTSDDGQVLYYFPGLEDINNVQSILQPVLAWANGQWTVANWNCCLSNTTVVSPAIGVEPGDRVMAFVANTCPADTTSCPTWNIFSIDLTYGGNTSLSLTPSDGQVFNWAFGGVIEPYYVISCNDFPNHPFIFQTVLFDIKLRPIQEPQWTIATDQTPGVECNYGLTASRQTITLRY